jgi:hypothetical protein
MYQNLSRIFESTRTSLDAHSFGGLVDPVKNTRAGVWVGVVGTWYMEFGKRYPLAGPTLLLSNLFGAGVTFIRVLRHKNLQKFGVYYIIYYRIYASPSLVKMIIPRFYINCQ